MRLWRIVAILSVVLSQTGFSAPDEKVMIRLRSSEEFCGNLIKTFASSSLAKGQTQERVQIAHQAARRFISLLRHNPAPAVVPVSQLGLVSHAHEQELRRYLSLGEVLRSALDSSFDYTLAFTTDELKFIPHSLPDQDILLIAGEADALTPERARLVAAVAQRLRIRISIVWRGAPTAQGIREATALAVLSGLTGGEFVDLNQPSLCTRT